VKGQQKCKRSNAAPRAGSGKKNEPTGADKKGVPTNRHLKPKNQKKRPPKSREKQGSTQNGELWERDRSRNAGVKPTRGAQEIKARGRVTKGFCQSDRKGRTKEVLRRGQRHIIPEEGDKRKGGGK